MQEMNFLNKEFERDNKTGALLNTDIHSLRRHKMQREQYSKITRLEKLCESMERDITKIKEQLEFLSKHIEN